MTGYNYPLVDAQYIVYCILFLFFFFSFSNLSYKTILLNGRAVETTAFV